MQLYGEIEGYELDPCPICGNPVKMRYYEENEPFTLIACGYEVKCTRCGIARGQELFILPESDPRKAIHAQEACEHAWNQLCERKEKRII